MKRVGGHTTPNTTPTRPALALTRVSEGAFCTRPNNRVTGKRALAPGVRVRRAITRVSEGWLRVPGYPLTAERTLFLDRGGGARSQGHNTGLRGLALRSGFPLAAERPLYSELGLRGLVPCTGFPLNCRTHPLLGASGHGTNY